MVVASSRKRESTFSKNKILTTVSVNSTIAQINAKSIWDYENQKLEEQHKSGAKV